MANGSADDRYVIAKYCIQDCNLVQYLLNKIDVITGYIEMAKICSVPINFLVMREVKVLNLLVLLQKNVERKILLCQHYKN